MCMESVSQRINLTFSSCGMDQFTCRDGNCVHIDEHRLVACLKETKLLIDLLLLIHSLENLI